MPIEPELIVRFVVYFIVAQFAIIWLMLPFAVFGTRKRMSELTKLQKDLISEITRLRLTVETMPGATRLSRRAKGVEEEGGLDGIVEPHVPGERLEPTVHLAEKHPHFSDAGNVGAVQSPHPAHHPRPSSLLDDERLERVLPDSEEDYEDDSDDDMPDVVAAPITSTKKKAKKKLAIAPTQPEESEIKSEAKVAVKIQQSEEPSDDDAPQSATSSQPHNNSGSIIVDIPEEDEISEDDTGYFSYRGERFEHLIDAMRQQQSDAQQEQKKAV